MKNFLLPVMIVFLIISCTSNPVGDDGISDVKNRVEGTILLDTEKQPERVYVWLEEFNLGAYSEPDGSFSLSIPPGLNSNIDGSFKLYFYVANYVLNSVVVGVRNGEFIPNEGALGKNGKLRNNIELEQFLLINTTVSPGVIPFGYSGNITIQSNFQTINSDTTTIVIPNSVEQFLGPVFFQNIETGQSTIITGLPLATEAKIIVSNSPVSRAITFSFNRLGLTQGNYRAVPVLFIKHQEIPTELLNSIDKNIDLLGNYLKRPISFYDGEFEVR